MATIKVACPKCGQKVSGDENFYGSVVECPICSADIHFPGERRDRPGYGKETPVPLPSREPSRESPAPDRGAAAGAPAGPQGGGSDPGRAAALEALAREVPVSASSASPDVRSPDGTPSRSSERAIDLTKAGAGRSRPLGAAAGPPGDDGAGEVPSAFCGAVSLVAAVLGVVTCVFGMVFCPVAIIFGHLSQAKARRSPVRPAPGQALGAAGLMIGYVWLVVTILILALAVLFKEALSELISGRFG